MTESEWYSGAVVLLYVLAAVTFGLLRFITAPYGRHERQGFGPTVPARLGWVVMESPSGLGFALIFLASGGFEKGLAPVALFGLWQLHYTFRTFIFPFRMRVGRPMPVFVMGLAILFNCLNAYVNARWIGHFGSYPADWVTDPRFVIGSGLFLAGFAINLHSDGVLRRLRAPGETGYCIPHEGLHRYVSAPNYFGEIIEWTGFALATWSPAGLGFAVYSVANLLPRALDHHRWYHATFEDYPPERKALIPFVL
ncbi:MAG: DUF1295 domain-containing protein [Myxococcota bacterium]